MSSDLPTNEQIAEWMGWKFNDLSWSSPDGKLESWPSFDFYTPDGMMRVLAYINSQLFSKRRLFKHALREVVSRELGVDGLIHDSEVALKINPAAVILALAAAMRAEGGEDA